MNMEQKRIVVVLGMHRSGTSAITRGLQVLGVDLGRNLMTPKIGNNDKGFWEDTDIVRLNDELLRTLGYSWHAFGPLVESEVEGIAEQFQQQAIELLQDKLSDVNVWGVKDPRMARLLPFWQKIFSRMGVAACYVVAFRNPMNIALSLARRDGFSHEKSYLLWLEHMAAAVHYTASEQRIIVDYDSILANPLAELERIATTLDLPFDSNSKEATAYVDEFLDETLRHGTSSMDEFTQDPAAPKTAARFAKLLATEVERANVGRSMHAEVENVWHELSDWRAIYQYARRLEQQITDKTAETSLLNKRLMNNLEATQSLREKLTADSAIELKSAREQLTRRTAEVKSLNQRLAAMQNSKSWKWTRPLRWGITQFRHLRGRATATGHHISERLFFDRTKSQQWIEALVNSSGAKDILHEKPLVSIVMPTWNRAASISKAIDSVLGQKYENWELIIVDDGSTDNTQELIKSKYSNKNIRLLSTTGVGVCGARNLGLEAAKGEYIAYLDSDNSWTPDYLQLMLCTLACSKKWTAYAALEIWDAPEALSIKPWYRQTQFNYESLKNLNFIDLNVFMHKVDLYKKFGGFDPSLKRMVDWDLIIRYTKDYPPAYANFIGAKYDNGSSSMRITNAEGLSWLNVIRNRHFINWDELSKNVDKRKGNVVSIVICVYGNRDITEVCLNSIFEHQAGCDFEVVLVDNGSDKGTISMLEKYAAKYQNIRLLKNKENYNFALGCNLGFAQSSGRIVVFLNNDTEVSPEWLRSLIRPLKDCPDIKGTQPKLLYPDGTIQNVGVVFSDKSPLGYPIYVNAPGDFSPTQSPRRYAALTAACFAIRAEDFASMRGFDPIYVNGQEDIDLCLRLGQGEQVFQYVPDSIVVHHEGKTPGRGKHIEANRKIFFERWHEKIKADDQEKYAEDNVSITGYSPDNEEWVETGYAVWRPELSFPSNLDGIKKKNEIQELSDSVIVAIKIGCPKAEMKDHWGDYHFAVSLAAAFLRQGVRARIDFLNEWESNRTSQDVNLVLRGLSQFSPPRGHVNLMWMISHPKLVKPEELAAYDHVFVASIPYAAELSKMKGISASPLLQCADASRFFPTAYSAQYKSSHLFIANSRKVKRPVVQKAIDEKIDLEIHGEMWEGIAPNSWIKSQKIENVDLPKYYSNAEVVLNDHWDDMRERGFVSNRIFDALACGASVVTDSVVGIPADLLERITFFDREDGLGESIGRARRVNKKRAETISLVIRNEHSFDNRAGEILSKINVIKEKN